MMIRETPPNLRWVWDLNPRWREPRRFSSLSFLTFASVGRCRRPWLYGADLRIPLLGSLVEIEPVALCCGPTADRGAYGRLVSR